MGGTASGNRNLNADEAVSANELFRILTEVSGMDLMQAYDLIDATQNLDVFCGGIWCRERHVR